MAKVLWDTGERERPCRGSEPCRKADPFEHNKHEEKFAVAKRLIAVVGASGMQGG